VHQTAPFASFNHTSIIPRHLTLTVEIGMSRTPQMMQEAMLIAPPALYGLILHDGGANTREPRGYLITRVHYQTVQASQPSPPRLSGPSSACRKSGSLCSCTAHPGIQRLSPGLSNRFGSFLPDEETLDIVDIVSTVLQTLLEFLRLKLPTVRKS
jgi:hypothetical protein